MRLKPVLRLKRCFHWNDATQRSQEKKRTNAMDAADATTKRWGSKRSLRQLCSLHCVRWMKGNHALLGLLTSDRSAFCSINYSDVNSTFFKTIAALSYGARRAVAHPIFWLSENLLLVEKFSSKNATFDPLWENLEIKLKLWALKCLKSATFRQDQDQTIVFFCLRSASAASNRVR